MVMLVLHSQGRCDGGEYISLAAIGSAQCFTNLVEVSEEKECFLNTEEVCTRAELESLKNGRHSSD